MKSLKLLLTCSLFLFFAGASLWGQVEFDQLRDDPGLPTFYVDLVQSRLDDGGNQLKLFAKVAYDEIQFLRKDDGHYQAAYDFSITIFDKNDFQVEGVILEKQVTVSKFSETNATDKYDFIDRSFELKPGDYKVFVQLEDEDSKKVGIFSEKIELKAFKDDDINVSDILFSEKVELDSAGNLVPAPLVNTPRKEVGNLYGFFQIYSKFEDDYKVEIQVKDRRNKTLYKDKRDIKRVDLATPVVIAIPDAKLSLGTYTFELKVKQDKRSTDLKEEFLVHWEGMPSTAIDLETAIAQMDLIANASDIKKIKKAPLAEQRDLFRQFWKQYDPTPGTEKNELMMEYYRRIQYANDNFRGLRDGWQTDMGTVYILLGAPDEVDREMQPRYKTSYFSTRPVKALQVWIYHTLNRYFIFVDENGFGEYRLDNPQTLSEFRNTFRY